MSTQDIPDNATADETRYWVCLMRHGIAVSRGSGGFADDAKRPLTPTGRRKMKEITVGLSRLGFTPDWIVTSPLVRAVETAEIVRQTQAGVSLDRCEALRPGGSPDALVSFLAERPDCKRVLLDGHEPDLSALAARFLGGGRHANLGFKKGGCCLIGFDEFPSRSPGQLLRWLTPRDLRKLA